jgi:hypothetical protein
MAKLVHVYFRIHFLSLIIYIKYQQEIKTHTHHNAYCFIQLNSEVVFIRALQWLWGPTPRHTITLKSPGLYWYLHTAPFRAKKKNHLINADINTLNALFRKTVVHVHHQTSHLINMPFPRFYETANWLKTIHLHLAVFLKFYDIACTFCSKKKYVFVGSTKDTFPPYLSRATVDGRRAVRRVVYLVTLVAPSSFKRFKCIVVNTLVQER